MSPSSTKSKKTISAANHPFCEATMPGSATGLFRLMHVKFYPSLSSAWNSPDTSFEVRGQTGVGGNTINQVRVIYDFRFA